MKRPAHPAVGSALTAAATGSALWWWWRLHPTPQPFAQRLWVDFPHPFVSVPRLLRALEPAPGQLLLDVGVGSARYAVPVAERAGATGRVVGLDLQIAMLRLAGARAARHRVAVTTVASDASTLPFSDGTFDGAWLVSVLGQAPDQTAVLREVRRVLRPGGRLVVGEVSYDPHGVFLGALRRRAAAADLDVDLVLGGRLGYIARLVREDGVGADPTTERSTGRVITDTGREIHTAHS